MCEYDEHQELFGTPTKSWLEYTMTQQTRASRNINKVGKVNYVKVTCNARPNNNHLITYCQLVCNFLK